MSRATLETHPIAILVDVVDTQWAAAKLPADDLVLLEDALGSVSADAATVGVSITTGGGASNDAHTVADDDDADRMLALATAGDGATLGAPPRSGVALLASSRFDPASAADLILAGVRDPYAADSAAAAAAAAAHAADAASGTRALPGLLRPAAARAALAAAGDRNVAIALTAAAAAGSNTASRRSGVASSLTGDDDDDDDGGTGVGNSLVTQPAGVGDAALYLGGALSSLEYLQAFRSGRMNAALLGGNTNVARFAGGVVLANPPPRDRWTDLDLAFVGTRFHRAGASHHISSRDLVLEAQLDADAFDIDLDLAAGRAAGDDTVRLEGQTRHDDNNKNNDHADEDSSDSNNPDNNSNTNHGTNVSTGSRRRTRRRRHGADVGGDDDIGSGGGGYNDNGPSPRRSRRQQGIDDVTGNSSSNTEYGVVDTNYAAINTTIPSRVSRMRSDNLTRLDVALVAATPRSDATVVTPARRSDTTSYNEGGSGGGNGATSRRV